MSAPAPAAVKAPPLPLADPVAPTLPTSAVDQPVGSDCAIALRAQSNTQNRISTTGRDVDFCKQVSSGGPAQAGEPSGQSQDRCHWGVLFSSTIGGSSVGVLLNTAAKRNLAVL